MASPCVCDCCTVVVVWAAGCICQICAGCNISSCLCWFVDVGGLCWSVMSAVGLVMGSPVKSGRKLMTSSAMIARSRPTALCTMFADDAMVADDPDVVVVDGDNVWLLLLTL